MAIISFADEGTSHIYHGVNSKRARQVCPEVLWRVASRKLDLLNAATKLGDLRFPPGNHLEALRDDRRGQHSIRINDQYRVCFTWSDAGAADVEITDYH